MRRFGRLLAASFIVSTAMSPTSAKGVDAGSLISVSVSVEGTGFAGPLYRKRLTIARSDTGDYEATYACSPIKAGTCRCPAHRSDVKRQDLDRLVRGFEALSKAGGTCLDCSHSSVTVTYTPAGSSAHRFDISDDVLKTVDECGDRLVPDRYPPPPTPRGSR